MSQSLIIFAAALLTALATSLGALPFLFQKTLGQKHVAWGNAIAVGFMIGASFMLLHESFALSKSVSVFGFALGVLFTFIADKAMGHDAQDQLILDKSGRSFSKRAVLLVAIMTLHSGAEGISIGVSFGNGEALGFLVTLAMTLQNIPEGLAIALVLIPAGLSLRSTALWCFLSSLPQPLLALPAYWAVLFFAPLLPWGLGMAAGAMLWICFSDLLADAFKSAHHNTVTTLVMLSISLTLLLQVMI